MKRFFAIWLILCFCINGTAALSEASWECAQCKTPNSGNFCGECGAAKPAWLCPGCGMKNESKFCTECGMAMSVAGVVEDIHQEAHPVVMSHIYAIGDVEAAEWVAKAYIEKAMAAARERDARVAQIILKQGREAISAAKGEVSAETNEEYAIAELFCNYSLAVEYDGKHEWNSAYANYNDVCTALLNYKDQTPAVFLQKAKEVTGVSLEQLEAFETWDEFYYQYALWLVWVGRYEEAAQWYEQCGDHKDSVQKKAEADEKAALQTQYQQQFQFRTLFDVDSAVVQYKSLYTFDADEFHQEDYAPGTVLAVLKMENTQADADIQITCVMDGKTYKWDQSPLKANGITNYRLSAKPWSEGRHYAAWYNHDVLIAYKEFIVLEGVSEMPRLIRDTFSATMELCLWNRDEKKMVQTGLRSGNLKAADDPLVYVPSICVENHSSQDEEIEIALELNGTETCIWKNAQVTANDSDNFFSSTARLIEGKNEFVWYVNGIEILRDSIYMTNVQ